MRAEEIKAGETYMVKVGGDYTPVRVDKIRPDKGKFIKSKGEARYDCTILRSGSKIEFRSAAKFRSLVPTSITRSTDYDPAREAEEDARDVEESMAEQEGEDCPFVEKDQTSVGASTSSLTHMEGEQSQDPTPVASPLMEDTTTKEETSVCSVLSLEPIPSSTPVPSVDTIGATGAAPTSGLTEAKQELTDAVRGLAGRIASARQGRQRGTPVAGMVPNEEQEEIIVAAVEVGLKVLVVGAGAGTGKTATLKMLEQIIPGRGQYTAFNASLVAESKAKFSKCAVNTTHSLAFRAVGKLYAHRLGGERMRSGQIARILGILPITIILKGMGEPDEEGKATDKVKTLQPEFLAGQVMVAIRRFCQSAERSVEPQHFKHIDGIDVPYEAEGRIYPGRNNNILVRDSLIKFARKAWDDLTRVDGQLPFSHDVYVKLWQLGEGDDRPIIAADYILLDEAQDTAPVFLDVLKQQKHALLVLVGDDNQQIYEWRGAVNAMGAFPRAPRCLLSQSYRFGQAVADVANTILAELEEPTDLVMRGMPSLPSRVAPVAEPRCYLYRTNAGAVGRVMQAVAGDKRPHLIGGGSDVVAWCEAAMDLQAKRGTRHPELCCFDSWGEVEEYSKTDEGSDLKLMVKLINEFGAQEIRDALKNMPKEEDADLVVSTAHKSKGREWDSVRLGPDFPVANKMTDSDRRLLYVAATRAKMTLDISECPPFCGAQVSYNDGPGGQRGEGGWVPGLEITYTKPMPTQEEQEDWIDARRHDATRMLAKQLVDKAKVGAGLKLVDQDPNTGREVSREPITPAKSKEELKAQTANGGFTWTKFDGGWFVRGKPGVAVGTRVEVSRKDGSKSWSVIRSVKHEFADAWVYGV